MGPSRSRSAGTILKWVGVQEAGNDKLWHEKPTKLDDNRGVGARVRGNILGWDSSLRTLSCQLDPCDMHGAR